VTPEQADRVLGELIAGYPKANLSDETVVLWADAIRDSDGDFDKAAEIARRWPRTHEWFPNLAEFLAVITPRNYAEPADDPDDVRLNPAASQKLARMWRAELGKVSRRVDSLANHRGAGGHWHGGPNPCPMCGGDPPLAPIR
jgi:hypothetical protein